MYLLKLANRNLKVLLSVGGYTYSQDGHFSFVTDSSLRATFVTSAVSYIENFGLDGIDIDFEYPDTPALAQGFADLLTELRTAFDALATSKGDTVPYQLTVRAFMSASQSSHVVNEGCAGGCIGWMGQLSVHARPADGCRAVVLEPHGPSLFISLHRGDHK